MSVVTAGAGRIGRAVALLSAALLLSSCYWTSYGFGWDNSRHNPYEHTIGVENADRLGAVWRVDGVDGVTGTPAVLGNRVYFGVWDGMLRAVDATTGAAVWATQLGSRPVDASVAVAGDRLYVGDEAGVVHAVDRTTGEVLWSTVADNHPNTQLFSSPGRGR